MPNSRAISDAGRLPLSNNCTASRLNSGVKCLRVPIRHLLGNSVLISRCLSNPRIVTVCAIGLLTSTRRTNRRISRVSIGPCGRNFWGGSSIGWRSCQRFQDKVCALLDRSLSLSPSRVVLYAATLSRTSLSKGRTVGYLRRIVRSGPPQHDPIYS